MEYHVLWENIQGKRQKEKQKQQQQKKKKL